MAKVTDKVYEIIEPAVLSLGVTLWDVRFVKEGASYYLRVYIDKAGGVTIDDCVAVSHAIDPLIDEADPIDKQYYLEVCSPGVERELTRDWHFSAANGERVKIKLFSAIDGKKEFSGILKTEGDSVTLITDDGEIKTERLKIAKAFTEYTD
ncbi:MAG: ribosome maturation factor RimP [Clostridia bacterium]|nr:ribosome maturation factor RimP [Clostridia bacterium]